ncbi:thiamine pyrophosphokinase [Acetitomaculum ruminis DSM 5522]|uniref:Thiamine diphosphokinase n=1 Tax=Acetitomaculum ruminis DSM 5522 TaxID=1120918 RepID=A0A1I0XTM3_9FIRM|nr:thiamine diphosphokinase [Acetitomaculum ruminis]SFB04425.1 thiamine pyrophosphokinase [Acetitomaculum ruminis DSM 5522]
MKNILIISGGNLSEYFVKQYIKDYGYDYIIAVDKGTEYFYNNNLVPDLIIGDFDSANRVCVEFYKEKYGNKVKQFDAEKDYTDTTIAVFEALQIVDEDGQIVILGGTGSRLDHVIGNIQILKAAYDKNIKCYIIDPHNRIHLAKSGETIKKSQSYGKYISFFPLGDKVTGLCLKGFKYNLENYILEYGKSLGVSNELESENACISFQDGILLMIESKD